MGRCLSLFSLLSAVVVFSVGCFLPRSYRTFPGDQLIHYVERAVVFDDYLSVRGQWNRAWKVSAYGVRVVRAQDDKRRSLEFKSYQFAFMKDSVFELEFTRPEDDAETVTIDVIFLSNRETQRVTKTLPLQRCDYKPADRRDWFERPPSIHAEW